MVLPYAMSIAGVGLGGCCLLIGAYSNYYSTFLLVRAGHVTKKYSYQELALEAYGKNFERMVKFLFFFNSWVGCVFSTILMPQLTSQALIVIFGNGLPNYLISQTTTFWAIVQTTLFVFPISLFRDLTSMRYVSLLCFAISIYLTLAVMIEAFNPNITNFSENIQMITYWESSGFASCLAQVLFAFTCHPNVLDTFKELQRSSKKRMSKILGRTIAITFLDYIVIGFFGYVTFSNSLIQLASADILTANYNNNVVITIAIVTLIFANIFGQPLGIKPAKDAFRDMLFDYSEKKDDLDGEVMVKEESTVMHFVLISIVTFSQMFVGMYWTNLASFSNIVGGIVIPIICFILPSMFYLKLEVGPIYARKKVTCVIFLLLSIVYTVHSIISLYR